MGALLDVIAGGAALADAWQDVLAADAEDDVLSSGVRRFHDGADGRLTELGAQLADGTYRPGPLTEVAIPKPDGGERTLRIPRVRDRIVERSILAVLGPLVEPLLGPSSFGYRPGLGVRDAVQEVAQLRDEGHDWVLRADVHDCFPTVPLDLVRRRLSVVVADAELLAVLDLLLGRHALRPGRRDPLPLVDCRRVRHSRRCCPTWSSNRSTSGCGAAGSRLCATATTCARSLCPGLTPGKRRGR